MLGIFLEDEYMGRSLEMEERKYGKLFLTEPALVNKPKIPMPNPSAYVE
jgi:hypothetical protein